MAIAKIILEYLQASIWPLVVLALFIIFRKPVIEILRKLSHVDLPGGLSVDLKENILEAKELSQKVSREKPRNADTKRPSIPLTEANARIIELGLRPSPSGLDMDYYRSLASHDPTLALAGLRIEIDILARNLAKGFKLPTSPKESVYSLLRKLLNSGAITQNQFEFTQRILQLCNSVIHGQFVSKEQTDSILKLADVLAKQYISWLSWGFKDGWKPKEGEEEGIEAK